MTVPRHAAPPVDDGVAPEPVLVALHGRRLVVAATVFALFLAAAHFVPLGLMAALPRAGIGIPEAAKLNAEGTVATWFSSALHLVNAGLLALLAIAAPLRERWRWWVLAVAVLAVSCDEISAFHEDLSWILQTRLHASGALTYAWVIPASAMVAVVAVLCFRLVIRRPGGALVCVAAAVFLLGAVGVEAVEGAWLGTTGGTAQAPFFLLLAGVEETLEMAGAILAMAGLLRMAAGHGAALVR